MEHETVEGMHSEPKCGLEQCDSTIHNMSALWYGAEWQYRLRDIKRIEVGDRACKACDTTVKWDGEDV